MAVASIGEVRDIEWVSTRTGVPIATLRWWRHLGDVGPKSFKIGRRVAYAEKDVEQWLVDQRSAVAS